MPTTSNYDEVMERYIASLRQSGWTNEQLQESGLIVAKIDTTAVTTSELSTLPTTQMLTTATTTTEAITELVKSTVAMVGNQVSDLITQVVSTSVNPIEKPIEENNSSISGLFAQEEAINIVSTTPQGNFVFSDSVSDSTLVGNIMDYSSDNLTEVFSESDDENPVQGWLSNLYEMATASIRNISLSHPLEVWEYNHTENTEFGQEGELFMGSRGVPIVVTWPDLSLKGGPLSLILLTVVALILGKHVYILH